VRGQRWHGASSAVSPRPSQTERPGYKPDLPLKSKQFRRRNAAWQAHSRAALLTDPDNVSAGVSATSWEAA
jgi:hypothetical protein